MRAMLTSLLGGRRVEGAALAGVFVATDLDPARRGLGTLRNDDLQHAVAAACLDAFRVGAVGQREATVEAAVAALDAREPVGLLRALAAALALDGEDALVHRNLDVVGIVAGQVRIQDEAV